VLAQVGLRLKSIVRDVDVVGRFGGDEFALLVRDINGTAAASAVAAKLVAAMVVPIDVANTKAAVGASVGIALFPSHGTSPEQLLQSADQAMYSVKRTSKNSWALAAPECRDAILPS
jgi:diguanylate cyclase